MADDDEVAPPSRAHRFDTTEWSVVMRAADSRSPGFSSAMEALCRSYWRPLYAFLRRSGHPPADAGDLAQGFFAYLIEKRIHSRADPGRGRFRTFLLASLKRYLSTDNQRATRLKRGGGKVHVPIDTAVAEERFLRDDAAGPALSAEQAYDREWANLLFDAVLEEVRREYAEAGQLDRYEALCTSMMTAEDALPYGELAPRLGLSEGGVKSAAHRLRGRFRQIFREHLGRLVEHPGEVDDEIQHLMAAFGGPGG